MCKNKRIVVDLVSIRFPSTPRHFLEPLTYSSQ